MVVANRDIIFEASTAKLLVLCAFDKSPNAVTVGKPAEVRQAMNTIRDAATTAGFRAPIIPHDRGVCLRQSRRQLGEEIRSQV